MRFGELKIDKVLIVTMVLMILMAGLLIYYIQQMPEVSPSQQNNLYSEELLEEDETEPEPPKWPEHRVVGHSVEGREIELYRFAHSDNSEEELKEILLVGGIHGGYEWNSVLLAYRFIDHLKENPEFVPEDVSVVIVPSANPDGVYKVIGESGRFDPEDAPSVEEAMPGRFNANEVDINRNFDCRWQPESTWRERTISGGSEPFSEPETRVIRDLVIENQPRAAIFWHSAAGAVYGSECGEGLLPETRDILHRYAEASGYPAVETFDYYEVTGAADDWMATIGIAGFTVELTTHQDPEWDRNRAGVEAVLNYYSE